jgi:hypothetical protein
MRVSISALLCAVCFAVSVAIGGPIAVTNFSFEDPDVADGTAFAPVPPGWVGLGDGSKRVEDPSSAQYANASGNLTPLPGAADGFQHLNFGILGAPTGSPTGALHQETSEIITANTEYLLTVAIGRPLNTANPGFTSIALTANGNPLISQSTSNGLTPGSFIDQSLSFQVLPGNPHIGQTLGIELGMFALPLPAVQFIGSFDNVRLSSSPIPEPSAAAAMMLCCGVMLRRRPGQHA